MFEWLWAIFGVIWGVFDVAFASGFGLCLGTIAGVAIGPQLFGHKHPKPYKHNLGVKADDDRTVEAPEPGAPVPDEMRDLLEFTEPWTVSPDYERTAMLNRVLAVMWPTLTKAVMSEVLKQVRPQLETQVFAKFAFIEDIVLGTASMRDNDSWDKWIHNKHFNIGTIPPRIGGIKCYDTSDDEVILEVPLVWGSDCKLDVGVFLRAGPLRLYVPLQVSHIQFKVEPRITIKPLVETVPCVGGATVTLLRPPHVDLSLKLIKGIDLLALPIIKDGLKFAIQKVLNGMLIYPNTMSFPIMPNFGIPPPAKGALAITLLRGENLKNVSDTYVKLEVRKGRALVSNSVKNSQNPEYNQEFHLVVDDFQTQALKLQVFEDDLGWKDEVKLQGQVTFGEEQPSVVAADDAEPLFQVADFIRHPMVEQIVAVPLHKYVSKKALIMAGVAGVGKLGGKALGAAGSMIRFGGGTKSPKQEGYGTLYLKVTFLPFLQPTFDDEEEEKKNQKNKQPPMPKPTGRTINHNFHDSTKGVFTLDLIRCINLAADTPTTWVRMLISDDENDQEHRSASVFSEVSPRWGQKFDFVMVTAGSVLYITVYDKSHSGPSVLSHVNPLNLVKKKKDETEKDKVLGKLRIPVRDVVRNGSIKDIWTLADTEKGQIELALSWQTCEIPDSI